LAISSRHQKLRITWSEYAHGAQQVAAGLRALGLKRGDRVGVWATNCVEWVMLQFGTALAGIVLVSVNPAYRSGELSFVLNKSRIRALFLHKRDQRTDYLSVLEESRAGQSLALEHVICLNTPDWPAFLRAPDGVICRPDPNEPANMQYTSGTTGSPKGVLLTHVNLVNNGRFIGQYLQLTEGDRICLPVPLFHCFGSVIGTVTAAVHGAPPAFCQPPPSIRSPRSKQSRLTRPRPSTASPPCSLPN
jgi:fatty-acyl-CoA synthase